MRILVLEDTSAKLGRLCAALTAVGGVGIDDIVAVGDAHQARTALLGNVFDLVVIDLVVPSQADKEPTRETGLLLLQEIVNNRFPMPTHIIAVTAFDELIPIASDRLPQGVVSLVHYDLNSDNWSMLLQARVRQVLAALSVKRSVDPGGDIAVVCALDDPELTSLLRLPWGWSQEVVAEDSALYWRGKFTSAGSSRTVYAASAGRMGMTAAAILAMKMTVHFRPRFVVLVGITAGVTGRVKIGDVIVADPVWDWGIGKWTSTAGGLRFSPSPHQIPLDGNLRNRFRTLALDNAALSTIKSSWEGDAPPSELRVKIGPLASGAAVLADGTTVERILEQNRDLLGVEMEAYGVFAAAMDSPTPRPVPLAIKVVVDFGDGAKNDQWQRYAAHISIAVLRHCAENAFFD
jgi:nucleoside phosphorylase